eukprot:CAMPEP_0206606032 /NCGR_PEP_ID=MMETSP0325_2-20121206/50920_1 /ASSEMBLY_ACC=CAM_ASM_000347 /TAXON_ID=2866 /ORGANISM="Crypthecodinium cohnii, Strain Seligo" /LENGTH=77 /DNA_ID=CAMNT_0054121991 /DNA_START=42 /DNA_END=272 /DNA_ORIENTATION=+
MASSRGRGGLPDGSPGVEQASRNEPHPGTCQPRASGKVRALRNHPILRSRAQDVHDSNWGPIEGLGAILFVVVVVVV